MIPQRILNLGGMPQVGASPRALNLGVQMQQQKPIIAGEDVTPAELRRRAMIEALNGGMTAPLNGGGYGEALARFGESYLRTRSARDQAIRSDKREAREDQQGAEQRDLEMTQLRNQVLAGKQDAARGPETWQDIPRDQLPPGARFGQRNSRTNQAQVDYAPAPPPSFSIVSPGQAQEMGLPPGSYQRNEATGQVAPVGNQQSSTFPADQRARVAITYQPALEASQALESMDAQALARQGQHSSSTPLGQDWGARVAEMVPFDDGAAARAVGGEDYNKYVSAMSTFESAILPVLSGAAVTESEARRTIRAALPQLGDSQEVLRDKSRRRQQMLNGAALIGGNEIPYPDAGVPAWASRAQPAAAEQQAPASPAAPASGSGISTMSLEELQALRARLAGGG